MKKILALLCYLTFAYNLEARRVIPPVQQVAYNGIIYSAPLEGRKGGVVEANDEVTKTKLWSKRIYGVDFSGDLEEDCQWILIKSLSVTNGQLVVVNEADHSFMVDLKTREVTTVSKDLVAFETSDAMYVDAVYYRPEELEITCTMLRFDRRDVEALAKRGQLDADHILQLWQADRGHLLAMPKINMTSGKESIVKKVTEITFPTELALPGNCNTNLALKTLIGPVPSNFEMREVGIIMQCVAEVSPDGSLIHSRINLQFIDEPSWKTYSTQLSNSSGKPVEARLDLPFFPVYSFQNEINVPNGKTVLIGGGIPTTDKKGFVFALLMAQIVTNRNGAVTGHNKQEGEALEGR